MKLSKGFDSTELKIVAVTAMTVDHIAWMAHIGGAWGSFLHLIGRITAPIMCFFIAEGYRHTRSVLRYGLRLLVFAAISHFPYLLLQNPEALQTFELPKLFATTSMIWTLLMGLIAITCADKMPGPILKVLGVLAAMGMAWKSDWSFFGVLYCVAFWLFQESKTIMTIAALSVTLAKFVYVYYAFDRGTPTAYIIANWFQLGPALALPLLTRYNGERGFNLGRYTFYLYYPLHLVALYLLIGIFT